MKAGLYDRVRSLVPVHADFGHDRVIPAGSMGTIVECYQQPREGYAVDLEVPDPSQSTGTNYENVILSPEQFEVAERHVPRPGE